MSPPMGHIPLDLIKDQVNTSSGNALSLLATIQYLNQWWPRLLTKFIESLEDSELILST